MRRLAYRWGLMREYSALDWITVFKNKKQPFSVSRVALTNEQEPPQSPSHLQSPSSPSSSSSWLAQFRRIGTQNDGLFIAAMLVLAAALYEAFTYRLTRLRSKFMELFFVTLDVRSHQREYDMLLSWLSDQQVGATTKNISFRSLYSIDELSMDDVDSDTNCCSLVPGYGTHFVSFNGKWLWVTREIDETKKHVQYRSIPSEVITVVMFSTNRSGMEEFVAELKRTSKAANSKKVTVFIPEAGGGSWERLCSRYKRQSNSLFLPEETLSVIDEAKRFTQDRLLYSNLGLPWRKGYLLEGPPGTGKSSFIHVVAGECDMPIYFLALNGTNHTANEINFLRLINSVPPKSILVFEDFDVLMPSIGRQNDVSVSTLLNALDGLASSEGRVLFITSNSASSLPAPLMRPGRIDKTITFRPMGPTELQQMMQRFGYSDQIAAERTKKYFADCSEPFKTPAVWQNLLLNEKLLFKDRSDAYFS